MEDCPFDPSLTINREMFKLNVEDYPFPRIHRYLSEICANFIMILHFRGFTRPVRVMWKWRRLVDSVAHLLMEAAWVFSCICELKQSILVWQDTQICDTNLLTIDGQAVDSACGERNARRCRE